MSNNVNFQNIPQTTKKQGSRFPNPNPKINSNKEIIYS